MRKPEIYKSSEQVPLLVAWWFAMSESEELKRIREQKLKALVQEQQRREALKEVKTQREKERDELIRLIFLPDAVTYLETLHKTKSELASRIEDIAITLYSRGQLFTRIPKTGVILVQRKLEGVEPKITVKRRGEDEVSFYEAVRKDLTEQE
ncbi:MAG: DNA-binding protein [Candidatus Hodarchaeota archaeon]